MQTVELNTQSDLRIEKLLNEIINLPDTDYNTFFGFLKKFDRQKREKKINPREFQLVYKIINLVPPVFLKEYNQLIEKRRRETLTDDEYNQMLAMIEQMERYETERLKYLIELAEIRKTSLDEVVKSMDKRKKLYI